MELIRSNRRISMICNIGQTGTFIHNSEPWMVMDDCTSGAVSVDCINLFNASIDNFKMRYKVEVIKLKLVEEG